MSKRPFEMILFRQLAGHLPLPVFLVDTAGTLIFYNEAAGGLLGMSFEEFGHKPAEEWGGAIGPFDGDGNPIEIEELPPTRALRRGRPAHGDFTIRSLTGEEHRIESTALPIIADSGQNGAMIFFWEQR